MVWFGLVWFGLVWWCHVREPNTALRAVKRIASVCSLGSSVNPVRSVELPQSGDHTAKTELGKERGGNNIPKCPILGRIIRDGVCISYMHRMSLNATHIQDTMIVLRSPTMKNKKNARRWGAHFKKKGPQMDKGPNENGHKRKTTRQIKIGFHIYNCQRVKQLRAVLRSRCVSSSGCLRAAFPLLR